MRYQIMVMAVLLICLGVSCNNGSRDNRSVNSSDTATSANKTQTMSTEENLILHPEEMHRVELQSRGASGLQLLYRCDNESIVQVKRVDLPLSDSSQKNIGGPVPAVFEIKALKAGRAKIQFYETRTWDKNFKEIAVKDISVEVK